MSAGVWAEFGIRAVSPSQLITWGQDRGAWYAKHRAKVRDDAGPAAWRGDAVEAGLYGHLSGQQQAEALAAALVLYEARSAEWSQARQGEVHPEHDERAGEIERCLVRAISAAVDLRLPQRPIYQPWAEWWPDGVDCPIRGRPDFCFGGDAPHSLDLKTTGQLPTLPKPDHGLACSVYALARGEQLARILYVNTGGDRVKINHRCHDLGGQEIAEYGRAARSALLSIQRTLRAALAICEVECVEPEKALAELCEPNTLAMGGGVFPIWRDDFKVAAFGAVNAWSK